MPTLVNAPPRDEPTTPRSRTALVAVVKTTPESILDDYARVMDAARFFSELDPTADTLLKLNLSWTKYFPACSSQPWQVEGVVKTLLDGGFPRDWLHPTKFSVMDGTVCGDGAGPHTMIPRIPNYLLVSADQLIRRGFLRPLERLLLHSPLIVWAPLASNVYHDWLWYPTMGQSRTREFSLTEWGRPWTTYREATDGSISWHQACAPRGRGVGLWGSPRSARVGFGAKPRLSNNG